MNIWFNTYTRIIVILQLTENKLSLEERASVAFQVGLDPLYSSEELEIYTAQHSHAQWRRGNVQIENGCGYLEYNSNAEEQDIQDCCFPEAAEELLD